MKASVLAFVAIGLLGFNASAATHEIKMLDQGKEGIMVFEPAYLNAKKGDTVKFIPTDAAHDAASVAVPKGAKAWKGEVSKAVTTTLSEEGVYLYECRTHIGMAMIGVIQVGKPTNLEDVKKAGATLGPKMVMNKDRLTKYLAQVK